MKQARLWVKDSIRVRQDDLAETWEKPSRTWPMPVLPRRAEPMQHGRLRIVLCRPSGVDGGHMVEMCIRDRVVEVEDVSARLAALGKTAVCFLP